MAITSFNPAIPFPALLALAALAISAAVFDISYRCIPNYLILLGAALGILFGIHHQGLAGLAASLLGLLVGIGLFLPGYLLRMTGGGDVKLMGALGSLLGPWLTLCAFLLYLLFGVAWALIYSFYAWAAQGAEAPFSRYGVMLRHLLHTGQVSYVHPKPGEALGRRLPMAPAIAMGAIAAPLLFSV
jgi:prepilin peptidase CpaA